jgi:hypothetical protein
MQAIVEAPNYDRGSCGDACFSAALGVGLSALRWRLSVTRGAERG